MNLDNLRQRVEDLKQQREEEEEPELVIHWADDNDVPTDPDVIRLRWPEDESE